MSQSLAYVNGDNIPAETRYAALAGADLAPLVSLVELIEVETSEEDLPGLVTWVETINWTRRLGAYRGRNGKVCAVALGATPEAAVAAATKLAETVPA